jgi:hypothetical protein
MQKTQLCLTCALMAAAILSADHSIAQQRRAGSLDALLSSLHAANWGERADAYEQLRASSAALARTDVRRSLLDLLERETQLIESTLRESRGAVGISAKYGEEYSEYLAELSETVDKFANWSDPRQVCIFVHESYDPESRFASKLAANGKMTSPCLLKMFRSDVGIMRAKAASVLVQVVAVNNDLDAETTKSIRDVISTALKDSDESVRADTVEALGRFGKPDMIPALQRVAEFDSAVSRTKNTYWIRERALKAIASIRQRSDGQAK